MNRQDNIPGTEPGTWDGRASRKNIPGVRNYFPVEIVVPGMSRQKIVKNGGIMANSDVNHTIPGIGTALAVLCIEFKVIKSTSN